MSRSSDDQDMSAEQDERLVAGEDVPSEPDLNAFAAALRATALEPPPPPSPGLAALLREGSAPPVTYLVSRGPHRRRAPLRVAAGLGLAVKLVLGAGTAAAATLGAATLEAVPEVVRVPAAALVDAVVGLAAPGQDAGAGVEQGPDPVPEPPADSDRAPSGTSEPAHGVVERGGSPVVEQGAERAATPRVPSHPTGPPTPRPAEPGANVPADPGVDPGVPADPGRSGNAPGGGVAPPATPPSGANRDGDRPNP